MGEPKINWIDVPTWDRATHYEIFRSIPQPQYCVNLNLTSRSSFRGLRRKDTPLPFP